MHEVCFDSRRRDQKLQAILDQAREQGIRLRAVAREELDRLSDGVNHQGIAARVAMPAAQDERALYALLELLDGPPFLLILDGVQDPHNLGACLRSADAAGVHAVIAPRDKAVGLTPVACKVASGAAARVPYVQVTNLVRCLKQLQQRGIWLVGTAGEASQSLYQTDLRGPLAMVMGGEGKGMRRLTREHCDILVSLRMLGVVESLNVSVASGVVLYEALRQRTMDGQPQSV